MVKQGSGRSTYPEIFSGMLSTLLLQEKLFTDQIGRAVWTSCYLMGFECETCGLDATCKGVEYYQM